MDKGSKRSRTKLLPKGRRYPGVWKQLEFTLFPEEEVTMSDMDLTYGKCLEMMEGEQIDLDKKKPVGEKNVCSHEAAISILGKEEYLISHDGEDEGSLKREKKKRRLNEDFVKQLEFVIDKMEQIVAKECLKKGITFVDNVHELIRSLKFSVPLLYTFQWKLILLNISGSPVFGKECYSRKIYE